MTNFYLIRHGATDAIGHSFSGRLPGVDLNETGRSQAAGLADRLRREDIGTVYSSTMDRALQTANVIAEALRIATVSCHAFDEIDVGDWSGLTFVELKHREDFHRFNTVRSLSRPPSGEMMIEVQNRAVTQLLALLRAHPKSSVAIVTHADVIKAALAYFLGIPLDLAYRLEIGLASVSVLRLDLDHVQVVSING